jgi:RimJ/RimL family protein N-acetyltransferase
VVVPESTSVIRVGDSLRLVGARTKLSEFETMIGKKSPISLTDVPSELATERLYVTRPAVLGKALGELNFEHFYGTAVTRITRAGIEFAAATDSSRRRTTPWSSFIAPYPKRPYSTAISDSPSWSNVWLTKRLTRICFNDYDRGIALVAIRQNPGTKADEIIGVARLIKMHGTNEAEFAIVVSDLFQGYGLGTHLLRLLVGIGRRERIGRITALILPENYVMQRVFRKVGFEVTYDRFNEAMRAELKLTA